MPIAPRILRDRLEIAMSHFDKEGSCLYCDMIRLEKEAAVRLVKESDKFIAFTPFASRGPFETWVFPKKHSSDFVEITEADCRDLAGFMKNILERFYRSLSNPDFNFALYSAPCQERGLEYFHWNIKIFPRVSKAAGFELGSGMMINTVVPEAAAKYLREA
jgi:UDPglucose--hexose-1-phosphate uridylyltransferase